MKTLLDRWRTEVGDGYVVSLVRAILGVLLARSALREVAEYAPDSYFGDVFHAPILPEALVPGRGAFVMLAGARCVLAALVIAGRAARPALFGSAFIGVFLLLCDRLRYHNNRYALFLFAFLLAFAPCDRAFVIGRKKAPDRNGPLWAQRLAQLQLAVIYVASGGSKLLDGDWRSGLVIGDRLVRSTALAVSQGVPAPLMDLLSTPAAAGALSKIAIFTELFLAVALFLPRVRFFALWWGVMFHAAIEVTSAVELFSWLSLSIYALFARPALRERILCYDRSRSAGRLAMRVVRALDWLARFELRDDKSATLGRAFVVIERDGSSAAGVEAMARIARAIPLLFPLSVPLFVAALPRRGLGFGAKAA